MAAPDPFDAFLDATLDEPDLDADADRLALERLRWGLDGSEDTTK